MSEALSLPPENPTILSFSGPDAARFLNGQITQDVTGLGENALPACVTDAKGRLQYYVNVFAGPEAGSLWVTCPKDQTEGLRDRLERYLIADEVEIEDLADQWTIVHSSHQIGNPAFVRRRSGHFGEGFDCWWQTHKLPEVDSISQDDADRLRIAARIPAWGQELTQGILPPEAGLDKNSISYRKGCYIGQEVLSRIKSAGKLNRRLAAFDITEKPCTGDRLILDSKEVGQLTSCLAPNALGYLKKPGFEATEFAVLDADGNSKGTATLAAWA